MLLGGLAGACIGPIGFWLRGLAATERLYERSGSGLPRPPVAWTSALDALGTTGTRLAFMLVAFLGTVVLMPLLLRWLEMQLGRSGGSFYTRAAAAGIVLGIGATMLTALGIFVTLLLVVSMTPPRGAPETDNGTTLMSLIAGAMVFGPLVAVVMPFFFMPYIVLLGVPFGVVFGALVRWLARD